MKVRILISLALLLTVLAQVARAADSKQAKTYESLGQKFIFEKVLQSDDGAVIWGFDFLNPDQIIFTERSGALKILNLKTGQAVSVSGAPRVWSKGQGGLLDVRVHPKNKKQIYLTYSEPVGDDKATTAVGMGTLESQKLVGFKKLLSVPDANDEKLHFGSRLEFDGKGFIYISVGDRNDRKKVQDQKSLIGKVIRLKEDGSVPADNPFVKSEGARPEIWSLGHRSPQGMAYDFSSGQLWLAEMGPRGGDEINLIAPGKNYGWPDVTYGREYYGVKIGVQKKAGTEPPVVYWVPSISPSGMAIYSGDAFPKWKGQFFLANLATTHVRRVKIENGKAVEQEELLKDVGSRFRNIRTGPDGALYVSTDDGQISRLKAVKN